jgi:large subunit ribosomal protein L21
MFAIIKTGGKQYKIQAGDILSVERIPAEPKQKVLFNQVLLIADDQETMIGTPYLEKAAVRAEVLENLKDEKVIVFKKKRRKQFRRTRGHRQELTRLLVEQIITDVSVMPEEEARGPEVKPSPAAAPEKPAVAAPPEAEPAAVAKPKPSRRAAKTQAKAEAPKREKPKRGAKSAKKKVTARTPSGKKGA